MIAYVEGYSDTDLINYCPACGAEIGSHGANGTGKCENCGMRFAVIEFDDTNTYGEPTRNQ